MKVAILQDPGVARGRAPARQARTAARGRSAGSLARWIHTRKVEVSLRPSGGADDAVRRWLPAAALGAASFLAAPNTAHGQATPDARAHTQLVYHPGQARSYLIGGSTRRDGGYHYFDDVWYWDGTAWIQAPALPFPRSSHRVVYHAQRNSLILFGGGFAQALRAEGIVWEWKQDG
jgi:hypothetical protein